MNAQIQKIINFLEVLFDLIIFIFKFFLPHLLFQQKMNSEKDQLLVIDR